MVQSPTDAEALVLFVRGATEEQERNDFQEAVARVARSNQAKNGMRQELDRIKDYLRCTTKTGGGSTLAVSSPMLCGDLTGGRHTGYRAADELPLEGHPGRWRIEHQF